MLLNVLRCMRAYNSLLDEVPDSCCKLNIYVSLSTAVPHLPVHVLICIHYTPGRVRVLRQWLTEGNNSRLFVRVACKLISRRTDVCGKTWSAAVLSMPNDDDDTEVNSTINWRTLHKSVWCTVLVCVRLKKLYNYLVYRNWNKHE